MSSSLMYGSRGLSSTATASASSAIWLIVSAVLALVGGILIYFLFLNKKNEGKFKGFWGWLYDFLSFKKMFIEALLKISYLVIALYITLASFTLISTSFVAFLLMLLGGNLLARIGYEFSLILLVICRNTTDINNKLNK